MSHAKFFLVKPYGRGYVVTNAMGSIMTINDLPLCRSLNGKFVDSAGCPDFVVHRLIAGAREAAELLEETSINAMLMEMDEEDEKRKEKEKKALLNDKKYATFYAILALIFAALYFTSPTTDGAPKWQTLFSTPTKTESPTSTSTPSPDVCSGSSCPISAEPLSNTLLWDGSNPWKHFGILQRRDTSTKN